MKTRYCFLYLAAILWLIPQVVIGQPGDREMRRAREAFTEGVKKGVDQEFEQAIAHFDQALTLNPFYSDALIYRGLAKLELQLFQSALNDFETVLRLDGDQARQAHYFVGLAHAGLLNHREAIHYLTKAIEVNPDHHMYFQRGKASHFIGDHGNALQDLDMAMRLNPAMPEGFFLRGKTRFYLELYREALEDLSAISQTFEGDPEFHHYFGMTLEALGRTEEAAPHLTLAEAARLQLSEIEFNRDTAEVNQGDTITGKENNWDKETRLLEQRKSPRDLSDLEDGYYNPNMEAENPRGLGIQIASYAAPERIASMASGYQDRFGHPVYIHVISQNNQRTYRMIIGSFEEREPALATRSILRDHGFLDSFIVTFPETSE